MTQYFTLLPDYIDKNMEPGEITWLVKYEFITKYNGFVYTDAKHIHHCYNGKENLWLVEKSKADDMYMYEVDDNPEIFVANKIVLLEKYSLLEIGTYKKFGIELMNMSAAVSYNYIEMVRLLLENGVRDYDDRMLIVSARCGLLEVTKLLVEYGVCIDFNNPKALVKTIQYDHMDFLEFMVENGANIEQVKNKLLTKSAKYDNITAMKYLIERHGAEINDNLLGFSAKHGQLDIAAYLIQNGANVQSKNNYALHHSAQNGYVAVVKLLLDNGADVHANDNQALRVAAINGYLNVVKLLVEHGADIHACNDEAFNVSMIFGYLKMARYLIQCGADINVNGGHVIINAIEYDDELVKFLVNNSTDINADYNSALVKAIKQNNLDIVKFLVENGADIHAKDDRAFRRAAAEENLGITKYLVECGANIYANDNEIGKSVQKQISKDPHTNNLVVKYLADLYKIGY